MTDWNHRFRIASGRGVWPTAAPGRPGAVRLERAIGSGQWAPAFSSFGADAGAIRDVVMQAFPKFTVQFEGRLNFMYLDDAAPPGPYVTTGVGDLIDPVQTAMGLPWEHKSNNSPASQAEVAAEWQMVKGRTDLAPKGGGAFGAITTLKLSDDAIDNLMQGRLRDNAQQLTNRYSNLASWPSDAQMALLSMSWAMGPGFNFPKFKAATDRLDFVTAATESVYKGAGSAPRIAANMKLWATAAAVMAAGADRTVLWWPNTYGSGTPAGGGTTLAGGLGYVALGAAALATGGGLWWAMAPPEHRARVLARFSRSRAVVRRA